MRKKKIVIIIALVSLVFLSGHFVYRNYQETKEQAKQKEVEDKTLKAVEHLKKNSVLGFDFLSENDSTADWRTLDEESVYGFNNMYAGKRRVTSVEIYSLDYNIYDLKVTDDIDLVDNVMESQGFRRKEDVLNESGIIIKEYSKYELNVIFKANEKDHKISYIWLGVKSESKEENIVYD
ncbi:hypothetical protein [Enterococcus larvae]|uniref:hypothetical protein n=1 Tax=Enterococcus larvae TaxID=2794352 RepID=UPI003F2A6EDC